MAEANGIIMETVENAGMHHKNPNCNTLSRIEKLQKVRGSGNLLQISLGWA
jgi:hypothetical protein